MPRPLLALFLLTFAFAGCQTLNHRDRNLVHSLGVSAPLREKMMHHEPLSLDDIIELTQKNAPPGFIVHYLQPTYFVYKLSPGDVLRLRQAGVSDDVIRYLYATSAMYSPRSQPVWYQDFDYDRHSSEPYWGYRGY